MCQQSETTTPCGNQGGNQNLASTLAKGVTAHREGIENVMIEKLGTRRCSQFVSAFRVRQVILRTR
jgi:hypothetical protein